MGAAIAGIIGFSKNLWAPEMNVTPRSPIMQRWAIVQEELIPKLGEELECLTPPLQKLIHVLDSLPLS